MGLVTKLIFFFLIKVCRILALTDNSVITMLKSRGRVTAVKNLSLYSPESETRIIIGRIPLKTQKIHNIEKHVDPFQHKKSTIDFASFMPKTNS